MGERDSEDERDTYIMIYYMKSKYKITIRLKTCVEPIWFNIMYHASFYSVLRRSLEASRMFQRNLEYTSISYNKT